MRINWIDNAKAIAILLVVIAHTKGKNVFIDDYIFTFPMPLFFFLSGYLLNIRHVEKGLLSFVKMQFKRLIIPYLSFWIISYIFWLPIHSMRNNQSAFAELAFYDPFIGVLYGINNFLYPNVELWFFTCLFITATIFCLLYKYIDKWPWLSFALILIIGLAVAHIFNNPLIRLPWNIEISLVALIFFSLGYIINKKTIIPKIIFNSPVYNLVGFGLLTILLCLLVKINGHVSMSGMVLGNPNLFILSSVIGIISVIYLSQVMSKNICFEWLSKNTIVIFPFHTIFFSIFTGIGVVLFHLPYDFKEQFIYIILYTIGSIIMCIPLAHLFRKYAPSMIGFRN